jgi:hypothetical protein
MAPIADMRAYAASLVAAPATGLIVAGAVGAALSALWSLTQLAHFDPFAGVVRDQAGWDVWMPLPIGGRAVVTGIVQTLLGIMVLLGAVKMKRLESYAFATASAIIAMIPCISPCCVLGLPFGIWALVVLSDIHVRMAFRS